MKNLIISFTVLLAVIISIVTYGIYSKNTTDTLSAFSESEKVFSIKDTDTAYSYWLSRRDTVALGINTAFADNITLSFVSLLSALESGNEYEINKYADDLKLFIGELEKINSISWGNVL